MTVTSLVVALALVGCRIDARCCFAPRSLFLPSTLHSVCWALGFEVRLAVWLSWLMPVGWGVGLGQSPG